jgi:hypothetical protein
MKTTTPTIQQLMQRVVLARAKLERVDALIRKHPEVLARANDYVVLKHLTDQAQSAAIGVNNAISWAHTNKYGAPNQPPLPEPPEFQNCPHCQAQLPYTYPKTNCPNCGKRLRKPNAFVELMRTGKTKELAEIHADIDATE